MDATFLAVIRMGLSVLTDRLLTVLAILMTFGLCGLGNVFAYAGEIGDCRRIWYSGIYSKPLERKG